MKRSQPAREWALALTKVEEEGECRACRRSDVHLEAAHVLGREHDTKPPLVWDQARDGDWEWKAPFLVAPQRIIPLCGPVGDSDGIELARVRLDPDDYTEHMRQARVAQIAEAA
jgi:hypothetical protein